MTVYAPAEDRPDGPGFSPILWNYDRRVGAARNHERFEGADVGCMTILDSYDRQLHPWLHGRRAEDIVSKVREVLSL